MPDATSLNASIMCFTISAIHLTTFVYTEQLISLIIGYIFMFLSYTLYTHVELSNRVEIAQESPEFV